MANEWIEGGSFDNKWGRRADEYRSKYFDGNSLKAGYTSRFLGNGESADSQGALATYTNDYDDMWDSYEPMRDRANYGIFGSPVPAAPKPAPVAAPAAPAAPAPSVAFKQQVSAINNQYSTENKRLTDLISSQTKAYSDQAAAYDKRFTEQQDSFDKSVNNLNNRVANAANAYDPTKNMGSSNNINPALSIQEKNKSLSSGTQRYNRNSGLNIKNVNL